MKERTTFTHFLMFRLNRCLWLCSVSFKVNNRLNVSSKSTSDILQLKCDHLMMLCWWCCVSRLTARSEIDQRSAKWKFNALISKLTSEIKQWIRMLGEREKGRALNPYVDLIYHFWHVSPFKVAANIDRALIWSIDSSATILLLYRKKGLLILYWWQ